MLGTFFSQSFPPKPEFTEKDIGDLTGKVVIITGGYSGVGYELAKLLYGNNAVIYIAGRREEAGQDAIKNITAAYPQSKGRLEFLHLDLADLTTIKASATKFLEKETRLDILWNNAGVMRLPKSSPLETKQGHELLLGTNCLGPYLFTKLLHPLIKSTAQSSPAGSVRVIWLGSITIDLQAPQGGIDLENLDYKKKPEDIGVRYAASKAGNLFIGTEWAKRDAEAGIIHLPVNPGNLKTSLQRDFTLFENITTGWMMHAAIKGAYTELFAGLAPSVTFADSGRYVIPFGRWGESRADIKLSLTKQQGEESSKAARFLEFCDKETRPYA